MLCIDQQGNMSLEGVIEEYENYGPVMDDEDIVVGALLVIGVAIEALYGRLVNRLRGGGPLALRKRTRSEFDILNDAIEMYENNKETINNNLQVAKKAATKAGELITWGGEVLYNMTFGPKKNDTIVPFRNITNSTNTTSIEPLRGGSGSEMLAWKNSLTRMYHTYQTYVMSPILLSYSSSSKYFHHSDVGQGPHLYWVYSHDKKVGDLRNTAFGQLYYWDGGFAGVPTEEVASPYSPKKNFKLGANGTIYIFAADWPGTVMNPDPLTYNGTEKLIWEDYKYSGSVTTPNYPRTWKSVFANTNWQYITVYGIQYRFDITNISVQDYVVEISLFKFKADIDAMDYEKQCLAHFGGYHFGTNGYAQNLNYMPIADVTILQTKRYTIRGMKNFIGNAWIEGPYHSNNRTVKMNIKRKYVLKRPLLNSYETNLEETDIFKQYYDAQKGIYVRMMAWPTDIYQYTNNQGLSDTSDISTVSPNIPSATDYTTANRIGNGIQVNIHKKAYFKLDENSPTF